MSLVIPGIVLFFINGLGSVFGALASFKKNSYSGIIAICLGIFLILWIILQVYWLGGFHWLHGLYIMLGIVELYLGVIIIQGKRK